MKHVLAILCIMAVLAVAAGCSQPAQPAPAAPQVPAQVTPSATSAASIPATSAPAPAKTPSVSDNTITIRKMAFNPSHITVKAGADVRWVNSDSVTHRIQFADNLRSPVFAVGDSWTTSFTKPGEYDYICMIHPSMQGSITVE